MSKIPIIDIRNIYGDDFDDELVSTCHEALTKTGFFYLKQDIISCIFPICFRNRIFRISRISCSLLTQLRRENKVQ